jgi:TRAP-type mannitol/chloroaromatic compound transport system permease large subunit
VKTVKITAMIMTVLLAGTLFTGVFVGGGGINTANILIQKMQLTPWMLLALMMLIIFIAGFFLDWISIVLIFLPLFTPLIKAAGFDPVWFCILFLIMIQTSYLTPPMAPAIFYLRAVAPPEITIRNMYRGVVPFIALQVVTLFIVLAFPILVTWLPSVMLSIK